MNVLIFIALTVSCSKSCFALSESLILKQAAFRPRNTVLRDNTDASCDETAIF
jgi:hypothetical protein